MRRRACTGLALRRAALVTSPGRGGRMRWRVGVDIGGTFTDVALVEEASGRIGIAKVPTTPRDFGQGVLDGLRSALAGHAVAAADVTLLAHATTVVTNALLEQKGARVGLVTSAGFR